MVEDFVCGVCPEEQTAPTLTRNHVAIHRTLFTIFTSLALHCEILIFPHRESSLPQIEFSFDEQCLARQLNVTIVIRYFLLVDARRLQARKTFLLMLNQILVDPLRLFPVASFGSLSLEELLKSLYHAVP